MRVCPANDTPFVLGCAASAKSDLLGEVFVVYAVIDEGRFHPRHCNLSSDVDAYGAEINVKKRVSLSFLIGQS